MKKRNNNCPSLSEEELQREIKELTSPNCPWVNVGLPKNPTVLEKAKYKIAKSILTYQQAKRISYEEVAKSIGIPLKQTIEVLRGNIAEFSLDELVEYGERLYLPFKVKITVATDYEKKRIKSLA
jgi:predicted XRE-type DNA-binding protein